MAGLAPPNLRLVSPAAPEPPDDLIEVVLGPDAEPTTELDEGGNVVRIFDPDGGVTVSVNGQPLEKADKGDQDGGWFENLAEKIGADERGRIAEELLRGIRDDDSSRQEWIEARKTGIQLLGLKVEVPGLQGSSEGAPVEGMSKVRHPLLLEAVLRFQANARSELLPTDGPVKIRDDDNATDIKQDQTANALQTDLNHYLTSTASEYYPDTDRMLLLLGFGGTTFKKVYKCPLRNRPVSETVDADDLIVSAQATDLRNARRVTHRVFMTPSTVKRLQILGVYRDISLSDPAAPTMNEVEREKAAQQGINPDGANPADRDRELYECYCELDVSGYEHKHKGKVSGLEIPYRVTIDTTSREILSIVRDYNKDTQELPEKRTTFVKYTFVPGLGFYDIGLLHILGNTTNALTAAWREMLDNGMFANFPGWLQADTGGSRLQTNIIRVPPGGGALVKTGGQKIGDAIMPLPYGTSHMPALQNLATQMAETGARVGGTSEQQVGEGRADAPVGTTLAMIDQATKILNSVHKRMHQAQTEEFSLLVECFRENPESFWQRKGKSGYPWDQATFLKALNDYDLVPQADPNTASHTQRVMKVMGLKQLQAASPKLYDPQSVDTAALQTLGWNNPTQFFAKGNPQETDPEIIKGLADIQNDGKRADAAMITAQANAAKAQQAGLGAGQPPQPEPMSPVEELKAKAEAAKIEHQKDELDFHREEMAANLRNDAQDRQQDHHLALLQLARDVILHPGPDEGAVKDVKAIDKGTDHG